MSSSGPRGYKVEESLFDFELTTLTLPAVILSEVASRVFFGPANWSDAPSARINGLLELSRHHEERIQHARSRRAGWKRRGICFFRIL
jgi:hypothetical protein